MQFMLNQTHIQLDECAPDTTLLEYLRTHLVQRGTKEGCASGDCGACTVVLAESGGDGLRYRAINSCITYLGAVDGCQVITVEGLSHQSGQLHPVQQAMVDQHASQCGFCTPGFVMSLFALTHQPQEPHDTTPTERIHQALGGNLCRCTGYRPIIDAAKSLLSVPLPDAFNEREDHVHRQLNDWTAINEDGCITLKAGESRVFASPRSSEALLNCLAHYPQARLVAGGTDLALESTQQLHSLPQLIYTGRVAEMRQISEREDALVIGAAVTYSEAEPILTHAFPALAGLLHRLGSLQVRNQGTLGGNIANASPIGDMPPVLLALDAQLRIRDAEGVIDMPIREFFTGYRQTRLPPGGFIEALILPRLQPDSFLRIYKLSKRLDDDISAVCLAMHLQLDQDRIVSARLGLGGMAATPARAYQAEAALIGQPFTPEGIRAAQRALAADFTPLTDVRASAEYRLRSASNLLLRAVLEYQGHSSLEVSYHAHTG
ncbi:xanthine dehydrogenase small subunit [Nitrincola iocasae]|uniref:Xanthine dehydrogenase small subunit n=1 Tax=Nitrincola iocasae TaxID=2614693 RepID=A0A5J6LIB1_9GAMM|nr:xanthine dehydrogenase small subunit [Nitrincola iocasae]QEW08042.1 xanthine dehydrogenase small subunit [Nitrincola iocasae]